MNSSSKSARTEPSLALSEDFDATVHADESLGMQDTSCTLRFSSYQICIESSS